MSIRYTIRHNISSASLSEEDVNDSSTWDLNLLRKHELAETDNHDIVYRQHDGKVVNWAEAATQQANEILEEVQDLSAHIDNQAQVVLAQLEEVSTEVSTLTKEAQEANESAQDALVQANLTVSESQANADSASESSTSAREWAIKMDGLVDNNEYSSKYYAQQSASSAQSASTSATQAETAKNTAVSAASTAAQDAVEDVQEILSSYVTSAQASATTASNKAAEAGGYASDAQSAKSDAVSAKNRAVSAKDSAASSATIATNKASEAATSANNANTYKGQAQTYSQNSAASANLAEQWATKTDGTVDGTEYSAKYYAQQASASATTAQDTADSISASLTQIATNTANIDYNSNRISNIEKLLQGNLYDYQTDSTEAYTKTVPAGAMPYAGIEQIGGKTLVWNQLVNSGATTVATISGRKYYTLINGTANIVTSSGSAITIVNDTADMVTDLTLCYGSGNEPTTVAEFQQQFPAQYYPYNAGTLLSAGVTEVVSKKADTSTIATYPIPAEIQSLEGYGWSAGNAYNEIDFERKVFIKRVARVDLGTLTWTKEPLGFFKCAADTPIDSHSNVSNGIGTNCSAFANFDGTKSYANFQTTEKQIWMNTSKVSSGRLMLVYDSDYKDADSFMNGMDGVYLYYELQTPVETDISAYLTDDNLIEVEADGTLTFHNNNGDNYRIPVPSTEEYMINLQEAVSNG